MIKTGVIPQSWVPLAGGRLDGRFWLDVLDQLEHDLHRTVIQPEQVPIDAVRLAIARVRAREK